VVARWCPPALVKCMAEARGKSLRLGRVSCDQTFRGTYGGMFARILPTRSTARDRARPRPVRSAGKVTGIIEKRQQSPKGKDQRRR